MKLPKSFIPVKDLEKNIEALVNRQYSPKTVSALLDASDFFLSEHHIYNMEGVCAFANAIVSNFTYTKENFTYTKEDLKEFTNRLDIEDELDKNTAGILISALTNRIIKPDDTIILYPKKGGYLGRELKHGTLILRGDAGVSIGENMEGGNIIVKGDILSNNTGICSKDGTITVEGKLPESIPISCKAEIYKYNVKVWPK